MKRYEIDVVGSVERCRTEAEILVVAADGSVAEAGVVFETAAGWQVRRLNESLIGQLGEAFELAVVEAKERLRRYVNRTGDDPPEGLSAAGLSLWLMEKDDGTAMGRPIK